MRPVPMDESPDLPLFLLDPNSGTLMTPAQSPSSSIIDKLPDPVLSDIFVLAYRHGEVISMSNRARLAFCYVISSVSHRWRMIALSTSRMWSSVNVLYRAEHLATHLARSREIAIDISLNLIHLDAPHPVEDIQKSLDVLRDTAHWGRARSLEVGLNKTFSEVSRAVVDSLNSIIVVNLSCNFQTIAVRFTDDDHGFLEIPDIDAIHPELSLPYSPTLQNIRLDQVYLSLTHVLHAPLPDLRLVELTRLNLGLSNLLYPLLSLSPNLTEMRLSSCSFWHGASDFTQLPSITLAKLETLSIYYADNLVPLGTILQACNLPNLKSLVLVMEPSLAFYDEEWAIDWGAIISQYHTLENLHIGGLSSGILAHLHSKMDKMNRLIEFRIGSDSFSHPDTHF
ncbi:hypothetical protein FRC12_014186 [Ceratobasidium sp. 428]|nr:hypothetical protein FRC12_014186 [Ceratobasidium sp. 428]